MTEWCRLEPADALQELKTDAARGLSGEEAARRLTELGPNELTEHGTKSPWRILLEQVSSLMVAILVIAAVASAALGDYNDAVVILAIVVINTLLGFRQEYRAEKTMAALRQLAMPTVRVRRDGGVLGVPARDLVPGDVVLLEAGNLVPADCRLLEAANLRIQEATLTGESEPVEKITGALGGMEIALCDRLNMVYSGTAVTYGRGEGLVVATGMETELGHIAGMIQNVVREATPLQKRLSQLGRGLAAAALALVALIFVLGLLRGEELRLMFLTAVSMAVAAVPEGLPAVVTIALALGAQRMLKRHALIRKLPAVETLGSVTVICSDKTGTLTQNQMTVVALDASGNRVDLIEELRHGRPTPLAAMRDGEYAPLLKNEPALALLVAGGALCNDALLMPAGPGGDEPDSLRAVGDPTEGALIIAAAHLGLRKDDLEATFPRVGEVPFDSERKRMTTIHRVPAEAAFVPEAIRRFWREEAGDGSPYVAFTKGAVDGLLDVADTVWTDGRTDPLDEAMHLRISAANDELAAEGMRVLGVAFRQLPSDALGGGPDLVETGLTFVGMVGMMDPARPEAREAVMTCRSAGIRPVMITGDHPLTAQAIAEQLGIVDPATSTTADALAGAAGRATPARIISGQEIERMTLEELKAVVEETSVFARVAPEHKLKIVQALQDRGHIVSMTGDGVNDAPALRKANIGVAMGITGTDVSKEAADMVLLDDNFATIVAAVKEGRVIYDNIRKFIKYLMTTNAAELAVMLVAPFLGMPLPLLPLQILWINLVTDGLPALALSLEPPERDVMRRPPHPPGESIFARGLGLHILWAGPVMGIVALGIGWGYWNAGTEHWQTMLFTVLTISQMFHVLAVRVDRDSLFTAGLFSNPALFGAVMLTLVLQGALIYVPFLQRFFDTMPLSAVELAIAFAVSSTILWAVELQKLVVRRRGR